MRFLLVLVTAFQFLNMCPCVLKADVIFSLSPASQTIAQGATATFDLFISSNTLGGDLVEGIDFNVNAGAGNGSGGVFTAAPTFLLGGMPGDFASTPGQVFSTNFSNTPITLTTPVLLATLTLDTTGVTPGTYSLTMDSLDAGHPTLGPLPFQQNSVTYEVVIAAIPEPNSIAMLTVGCLVFNTLIRRRRT